MIAPGRVLFSAGQIEQRVGELALDLSRDYQGRRPIFIGVLRGVAVFICDLLRAYSGDVEVDFLAVSAYGTGGGVVRFVKDLDGSIEGRDVVLIEDIIDTGLTLRFLVRNLQARRPSSLRICTLLDKRAHRLVNLSIDYIGFAVDDVFVVGYGLDDKQLFRNLPDIWAIESPPGG